MKKLFIPLIFTGLLLTGCLDETTDPEIEEIAEATVIAEFTYAETGDPVSEESFVFSVETEDTTGPILLGEEVTNSEGVIETGVTSTTPEVITRIIFTYEDENLEVQSVEEDVILELRFEEPFDSAELAFDI
jgi:hypothetical protein